MLARPVGAKGAECALPASVKGGVVAITARNTTRLPREAQLIRVDDDRSTADDKPVVESEDGLGLAARPGGARPEAPAK